MTKRALLVIDLQNGVGPLVYGSTLMKNVNMLVDEYHATGRPVIFIQHQEAGLEPETDAWQLVRELHNKPADHYVRKTHADAFYHTTLADLLTELDATELEICGAEIPYCIDATIKAAFDREYKLFMRRGVVSTEQDPLISFDVLLQHYEQIWENRFVQFI